MSNTTPERTAFEAWAKANGYRVQWMDADDISTAGYTSTATHHAWEGYCAALAATPAQLTAAEQ